MTASASSALAMAMLTRLDEADEDTLNRFIQMAMDRLIRDSQGGMEVFGAVKDIVTAWEAAQAKVGEVQHAYIFCPAQSALDMTDEERPGWQDESDAEGRFVDSDEIAVGGQEYARALTHRRRQVARAQADVDELLWLRAQVNA
jgi:hypothetical protein